MKIQKHFLQQLFGIFILGVFLIAPFAYGTDLTSTSFIIRDPLVGTGGGYGTSASFTSYLSGDLTAIGRATSASFEGRYGFLWYPSVTQGVFSAVANGSDADLTWGASTGALGWNVSGYRVGKSSVSGGPYTYTAVGNVTDYSYTGLTFGYYCFVLETLDAFSTVIATSSEQCITIQPTLTFTNNDATIGFGTLTASAARWADGATDGEGSTTTAHTMTVGTNAPTGYTLSYMGALLTNGSTTIDAATITGDADGTPGSNQFALGATVIGTGTVSPGYSTVSNDYTFVAGSAQTLASASVPASADTVTVRYIANIASSKAAGSYATNLTYILTGNF